MSDNIDLSDKINKVEIKSETYVCPNCGGTMSFDIKNQKFMCPACKTVSDVKATTKEVKEYDFDEYHERERLSVPFEGVAVVFCQNCGSEITFTDYQVASTCPMCSSTQIATVKQSAGIAPDGIVPFKVDKQDAQQKFRQWAKTRWFAPNDFKKSYGEGGLKGMYLPFWTYDANAVSHYTGMGGRYRMVRDSDGNTKTVTDWFPTSGVVEDSFDDVQVCASDKETQIKGILPYRTTSQTVPYSAAYLSGYYAEIYKIKADICFNSAKQIMEQRMTSLAHSQIRMMYDVSQVLTMSTKYYSVKYKHVLLPLWGSVFGYKGKKYRYLINGETGVVTGQRPYSIPKIVAAVLAGLVACAIIFALTSDGGGSYSRFSMPAAVLCEYDETLSINSNCYIYETTL